MMKKKKERQQPDGDHHIKILFYQVEVALVYSKKCKINTYITVIPGFSNRSHSSLLGRLGSIITKLSTCIHILI